MVLTLCVRDEERLLQVIPALSQWLANDRSNWRIAIPLLGEAFAFVIYADAIRWPMEERWSLVESISQASRLAKEDAWLVKASLQRPYDFE